jgi:hypothetical protein
VKLAGTILHALSDAMIKAIAECRVPLFAESERTSVDQFGVVVNP